MSTAGGGAVVVREIVARLAHTLVDLPYETWGFGDSVAFEAMIEASDVLGDEQWAAFARGWARAWATRALPYRELDCTAPGRAMVTLAERYNDPFLIEAAIGLADHLLDRPLIAGIFRTWEHAPLMHPYGTARLQEEQAAWVDSPPSGAFLDCLHFDPPFLTALGRHTGKADYSQAGLSQALAYIAALQQPDGTFDHFVLEGVEGTFGPGWGRGQGWALLGLLDVLDTIGGEDPSAHGPHADWPRVPPEGQVRVPFTAPVTNTAPVTITAPATMTSSARTTIILSITHLIEAMIAVQRPDGHWAAVISDPASGVESSTAAFMAAGFARALEAGIIPEQACKEVEKAQLRAAKATLAALDPDATLAGVSAAVMACTEPTHYSHVPRGFRVPWGQGPALLAAARALRPIRGSEI